MEGGKWTVPPTDANLNCISQEYLYEDILEATENLSPSSRLGEGTYGSVFRGMLRDGTEVAVKHLGRPHEAGFREEVEVLSRFRHPNLVILMGFARHARERYLVYELLPGGDVCARLQRDVSFRWPARLRVAVDAALGLSHLHGSRPQVFHRDIKTQNILMDRNGTGKMADFGLALLAQPNESSLQVELTSGTIGYADPLYIRTGHVTERSEVYSFGMVLLETLTRRPPALQHANGRIEYQFSHLDGELANVRAMVDKRGEWPPQLADEVGSLALRCTHKQEALRPVFVEVLGQLRQLLRSAEAAFPASSPGNSPASTSHDASRSHGSARSSQAGLRSERAYGRAQEGAPATRGSRGHTPPRSHASAATARGPDSGFLLPARTGSDAAASAVPSAVRLGHVAEEAGGGGRAAAAHLAAARGDAARSSGGLPGAARGPEGAGGDLVDGDPVAMVDCGAESPEAWPEAAPGAAGAATAAAASGAAASAWGAPGAPESAGQPAAPTAEAPLQAAAAGLGDILSESRRRAEAILSGARAGGEEGGAAPGRRRLEDLLRDSTRASWPAEGGAEDPLAGSRRLEDLLGAARRADGALSGSRRPEEALAGARRPEDHLAASRRPEDLLAASRRPEDVLAASRRPEGSLGGAPRPPEDALAASRRLDALLGGPRRAEDPLAASRRVEELLAGVRRAEDALAASRRAEDALAGSVRAEDALAGSRRPAAAAPRNLEELLSSVRRSPEGALDGLPAAAGGAAAEDAPGFRPLPRIEGALGARPPGGPARAAGADAPPPAAGPQKVTGEELEEAKRQLQLEMGFNSMQVDEAFKRCSTAEGAIEWILNPERPWNMD